MLERSRNRNLIHLRQLAPLARWLLMAGLVLTAPISTVRADTYVGGPIVSNTTWTLANSPYIVVESVEVWEGVTLTIEPGVAIRFASGKILQVHGTLIARGTSTMPITFTSNLPSPQPGDWGNVEFTDTSVDATFDGGGNYISGSIMQYCIVEFGGGGTGVLGAIQTNSSSPLIDHCSVHDNYRTGISCSGTASAPTVISNNTVYRNSVLAYSYDGGGINASYARVMNNVVASNTPVTDAGRFNGGGIYASASTVTGNIVVGHSILSEGGGIYARDSTIMTNTVISNSSWLGGGIHAINSNVIDNNVYDNSAGVGGGINALPYDDCTVSGNTVTHNVADVEGGGISSSECSVAYNIVTNNSSSKGGGIEAFYGTLTGNIVDGNSATTGGGIYSSYTTMMSNSITANRVPIDGQGSGVYYRGYYSREFLYNTVVNNTTTASTTNAIGGLTIDHYYGSSEFHYNNLYGNYPYDVVILTESDNSGTNNYWGTVSTVDILAHVYDWYDDTSRGRFLYIPYLQDPDPNAPVPPPRNLRGNFTSDDVALSWDAIPSTTAGYGYKIYYDTDGPAPPYEGTGVDQGHSPIDVGNVTEYTLTGLEEDATYYLAVTAYDTLGREGWYSNVVNNIGVSSQYYVYLPLILR